MPQTNILILGDSFIPIRAARIPEQFKAKLQPDRINSIICTGNMTSSLFLEYLKQLCPEVTFVHGLLDDVPGQEFIVKVYGQDRQIISQDLSQAVGQAAGIRIGVVNGYQAIPLGNSQQVARFGRQLDAHVLCFSGELLIKEEQNVIVVRPGSITGVYGNPSFVVATTDGVKIQFYSYELVNNEVVTNEYKIMKNFQPEYNMPIVKRNKEEIIEKEKVEDSQGEYEFVK